MRLAYNPFVRCFLSATVLCAVLTASGQAQTANPGSDLQAILSFETEHNQTSPSGWGGGPAGTIFVDGDIVHSGRWSARFERTATSPKAYSVLTKMIPIDFAGTTIEWRGFLRSEDVSGFMALWMREDGDTPGLAFDNMQQRQVKGTHDWAEYSITLPVHREAKQLYFGVLAPEQERCGRTTCSCWWTESPHGKRPAGTTEDVIDLDHEFDAGSGIVLSELTGRRSRTW